MLPTIKTEVVSSRDSVFKVIRCHFPIAERSSKVTKLLREAAALSSALGVRQVKELKKGSEAQCGGLACSCSAGREGEGFSEGITGLGVGWAGEPLRGRCSTAQGQKLTPWLSGHLSQQYHSPGWRSIPLWMAAARAVCCWRYSHSGHGPLPCSLGALWQVTPPRSPCLQQELDKRDWNSSPLPEHEREICLWHSSCPSLTLHIV